MDNPLLQGGELPPFSQIRPEHIVPALEEILASNRASIAALVKGKSLSWDSFILVLEQLQDRLQRMWSPVGHLNAVMNNDELREIYNQCLPKLSEYYTELGQHADLYRAYKTLAESPDYPHWSKARQMVIQHALRDFRLSGIELAPAQQRRFKEISQRLSELASRFSDNVLDATQAWKKQLTDATLLAGLPASALAQMKQAAEREGKDGWIIGLDFPCYFAVMSYADRRDLRKEVHDAYVTRASDQGPFGGRFDNEPLMEEILALRAEKANLLGFANFAELSLATKMAPDTERVIQFINDLAARSKALACAEFAALTAFASERDGLSALEPWDTAYYSEKLRQHTYAIDQEALKPYFPAQQVISGMFGVVKRLYGLEFIRRDGIDTWHPDVYFYEIYDQQGQLRGKFYLDLYTRPNKRGGAWMDECVCRRRNNGQLQIPVAYLTCNFSPPVADLPALLTHQEVNTLFHEFGHGLHHLLTQVDELAVSGINGVAWDAVELPSQFMENFCWDQQAIEGLAKHHLTHQPLPAALYEKLAAAKNFQAGLQMLRQLEFALFDFRLHKDYKLGQGSTIQALLNEIRDQIGVLKPAPYNRFQHSFSHIFGGGYAAGYFSYKWAEVLSADAFAKFEETGVFNQETGRLFLREILEKGGSEPAMDLFVAFRGREPRIEALLRHTGIAP